MTIFDGGSNVVASGEFLESRYPWMTRIHGSEHVISLIIGEICKIPEVATMNSQRSDMFNHVMNISKVKAMLDVESKKFNNGRALTPRYFVRRLAWHDLDHAWEIEDRV